MPPLFVGVLAVVGAWGRHTSGHYILPPLGGGTWRAATMNPDDARG
jgi:hypothetical protein